MLQSILLTVHFHTHPFRPAEYPAAKLAKPNLAMEVFATLDNLFNYLGLNSDGSPVLTFTVTVPFAQWRSDGTILSVRDLERAQVIFEPVFGSVTGADSRELEIWQHIALGRFDISTGDGRWFEFQDWATTKIDKVPVFIGYFR